jgi:hypothetical protein
MTEGLVERRVIPHTLLRHVRSRIGEYWFSIHNVVSELIHLTLR